MNIKFMMMFVAAVYAWNVQAQDLDASLHEPSAQPIPLIEDDVFEEGVDLEAFDPTISYYVQNLNLSPDQLAKARQISESGRMLWRQVV